MLTGSTRLQRVSQRSPEALNDGRWLAFAVPSMLYSLNNNLDMLNNQHMDPATEQVFLNSSYRSPVYQVLQT